MSIFPPDPLQVLLELYIHAFRHSRQMGVWGSVWQCLVPATVHGHQAVSHLIHRIGSDFDSLIDLGQGMERPHGSCIL